MSAFNFLEQIYTQAKTKPAQIILPETDDPRIISAANKIAEQQLANLTLIGPQSILQPQIQHTNSIKIYDSTQHQSEIQNFTDELYESRKSKGLTIDQARILLQNHNYIANFLLKHHQADAIISGSQTSTADTIRPALQIIKSQPGIKKISSFFFILLPTRSSPIIFADCAIQIDPTPQDLAEIATLTAQSAQKFNLNPSIAFLSFSTNGSATHEQVTRIQQANQIFQQQNPNLPSIGEVQADAALIPEILSKKFPTAPKTQPNILIFPDLNSGNIAYKLVERLAQAKAIGPILQGLNHPVNDLSRGCSTQDIIDLAAITSIQSNF